MTLPPAVGQKLETSRCKRVWSGPCRRNARGDPVPDPRVLMERDDATGIARITLNNPDRRNAYDPAMRVQLGDYLDALASHDVVKAVVLRRQDGLFSPAADMCNAY